MHASIAMCDSRGRKTAFSLGVGCAFLEVQLYDQCLCLRFMSFYVRPAASYVIELMRSLRLQQP